MGTPRESEVYVHAAERLLEHEARNGDGAADDHAAAAGRVYEALFEAFAPVIGARGIHALLARSLKLAGADAPCLGELELTDQRPESGAEVALQQLVSCLGKLDSEAASKAATALYANLFGLMTRFIGERLVFQMMKSAFPVIDETVFQETP